MPCSNPTGTVDRRQTTGKLHGLGAMIAVEALLLLFCFTVVRQNEDVNLTYFRGKVTEIKARDKLSILIMLDSTNTTFVARDWLRRKIDVGDELEIGVDIHDLEKKKSPYVIELSRNDKYLLTRDVSLGHPNYGTLFKLAAYLVLPVIIACELVKRKREKQQVSR